MVTELLTGVKPPQQVNGKPVARVRTAGTLDAAMAHTAKAEPKSIPKLVEAIERDYQFRFGYLIIEALCKTIDVTIEVSGADPRADALSKHLVNVWHRALPSMLRSFAYGRVAFEKVYGFDRANGIRTLRDLDAAPFEFSEMALDDGAFAGITIKAPGVDAFVIPPESAWWLAIDATPREPHGRSRYLGAPLEVWKQRNALEENEGIFLGRFALGQRLIKAPRSLPGDPVHGQGDIGEVDENGKPIDRLVEMQQSMLLARSGGSIIVSSGNNPDGTALYEMSGVEIRPDAAPLERRRVTLDAAAMRSLGIAERTATQDAAVGTNSMAETHADITFHTIEAVFGQIAESFQRYVIDKLTEANFGDESGVRLLFTWQSLAENQRAQQITLLVHALLQAPSLSPLITSGAIDLARLLTISQLPLGADLPAALAEIKAQAEAMLTAGSAPTSDLPISFRLATNAPPASVPTEDDIVARGMRENGSALAEILKAIEDPANIDRRRL